MSGPLFFGFRFLTRAVCVMLAASVILVLAGPGWAVVPQANRDPNPNRADQAVASGPASGAPDPASKVAATPSDLSRFSERLARWRPKQPVDCNAQHLDAISRLATELESWAAGSIWSEEELELSEILLRVEQLVVLKEAVDQEMKRVVALRRLFVRQSATQLRRAQLRYYLRITSRFIDLSGRLRYLLRDAISSAALVLETSLPDLDRLVQMLAQHKVQVGAEEMAYVLFDPPADAEVEPFSDALKKRVLHLIRVARSRASLPALAEYVQEPGVSPELMLAAAEAIWLIGVPQQPRSATVPESERPVITARHLHDLVARIDDGHGSNTFRQRRLRLLKSLDQRAKHGVQDDSLQLGDFRVRAGDWLLMRNPSPYNLFTDLSPGLFTHVGVAAVQEGADGVRRLVIVDLPERGDHIPATNVDVYLGRTLHFFFVRHEDDAIGRRMGRAARDMIGNPSQFDLLFRTDRVAELQGQPLAGRLIHTYCAGLLLICAQTTGMPRKDFFPFTELPAGGHCAENLASLGISIGRGFVSPSGAIFSPKMKIVGACEPMYDPTREVKEAIYDHFALQMRRRRLHMSPDIQQKLVVELARMAKSSPWLARILARANRVSENMDLEAAARTAAVVETLDEIANANVDAFLLARRAVVTSDLADQQSPSPGKAASATSNVESLSAMRTRHATLVRQWQQGTLSPFDVRRALVCYYRDRGIDQLDVRFFRGE